MKSTHNKYLVRKSNHHTDEKSGPIVILENTDTKNRFKITGFRLESQIALENNHTLLFLTAGCPFEETLYITLLSSKDKVLDTIELFGWYTTGVFEHLQKIGTSSFSFTFFAESIYYLTVYSSRRFTFWAPRFWHPFFRRSYFCLYSITESPFKKKLLKTPFWSDVSS